MMNKISKQMYTFSFVALSLFSFVLASWELVNPVDSANTAPVAAATWVDKNLSQSANSTSSELIDAKEVLKTNYVTHIKFSFCDNGATDKWFALDAGKEQDVCVQFQNALNMDIKLWTEIVDGYTIEPWGIRWCLDNPSGNKQFIPGVITPSRGNSLIDLPAWKTVKQYVKMKFPNGSNGVKHACFTYGVTDSTADLWANFSMRFRRESYVDFIVKWGEGIKSQINMLPFDDGKIVKSYLDLDDKLIMEFKLQNTGSVDEMVTITGFVHNMFGFTQPFTLTGIRLNVGMTKTIRTSEYGIVFDMPFYKWLYNIERSVQHKPFFEFDVSSFGLDPKVVAGGVLNETWSAFFFPWLVLAALLALILFIKMAFFKKARIVYVQQAAPVSQAPVQQATAQQPVQTPTNINW